ncbi:hypothetical protein HWV07_10095 [Natronomonas salina]|uniref:hypothetical protein n=1 Tax=Natronomonas salina TaxID=1710540 RepID=UPI0015B4BA66|nr:hypothetical protein [Natronomonas salina]QLD89361.1 hypothetical protein HWV07_10095 [Natronomonas salina]
MAEVEIQTGIQENTVGMVDRFAEVAATDPLSAVLVLVGALLVAFSAGFFGVLTFGAGLASIKRLLPTAGGPPRQAR